jgi:hypothetical protein
MGAPTISARSESEGKAERPKQYPQAKPETATRAPTLCHKSGAARSTARVANQILGRTGTPFWQDESFDHWIRSAVELQYLIEYVENNPLKAGLVEAKEQWRWSSAGWLTDDKNRSSVPPLT